MQSKTLLILGLCLFGFQLSFSKHVPNPWIPVDWTTIPQAEPSDKVEVWYLTAPLMEATYGDDLEYASLYHGAIGFNNTRTGDGYSINYDAFNFLHSSIFPEVVAYSNGSRDLNWVNGGASFIYSGINITFWHGPETTIIAWINGSVFNSYLSDFNAQINASYPYYNMLSITADFNAQPWVPAWDCFDFVWLSFGYIFEMGGDLDYSKHPKRNFANVYSSAPVDVTDLYHKDPEMHDTIVKFYELLDAKFSDMSWFDFFAAIVDLVDGEFFVRVDESYWKCNLQTPYLGMSFWEGTLPGKAKY
eukprot:TRINITY_DN608_c0_g1_i1.p2 TRINITY_DN608_c0_g1~~TRINITY_DN608_c0_g1_i1.p2  ORF type:complete len:303 (+),score=57.45 TRINITY_DN608_c0_g1_i1:179-1087(+)